jgi:threonine synthase
MPSRQVCAVCGEQYAELDPVTVCRCGGLLQIEHDPPLEDGASLRRLFDERRARHDPQDLSGVWRFREIVMPSVGDRAVTHPEGNTPLLHRDVIGIFAGAPELRIKHEGHNPTGSFKDRGMTVAVTQARRLGARAVACASTGNTSASLAAYAAQAAIPALVFVPRDGVALGKLSQSLAYGAKTLLVDGDFDTCLALAQQASRELGIYLVNSINPWRLEGQKTIVLELLQQLGWQAPDWIVLPAGNLGNTAAFGKALRDAHAVGLIDKMPHLASIQAAGAAPFARGFREDFVTRHKVKAETVATAIKIGDPASWDRAVQAIRETKGTVTFVEDRDILEAKAVVDAAGVGCEPASAASIAGLRRLTGEGIVGRYDRIVAVLTGHVLKDPGTLLSYHRDMDPAPERANRPFEISASVAEVERVLDRVRGEQ